jgi:YD repeat-containing protein
VDTNSSDSTYGMASDTEASDGNGNQTYDGTQAYTYDAWNRLMTVSHAYRDGSGTLQHGQAFDTMAYDARGRRILKAVNGTGAWDCTYHYYLAGDSVVEEQNGSAEPIKQYVWGKRYIDELLQTSLNSNPTGQTTCDTPYWGCQDANWNVLGIVSATGTLTERYEYTPYGQRQVLFSPGGNDPLCYAPTVASRRFEISSSVSEPWEVLEVGHQGLLQDAENSMVYSRSRTLSPTIGRWLQRDPLGIAMIDVDANQAGGIVGPSSKRGRELRNPSQRLLREDERIRIRAKTASALGFANANQPAYWQYADGLDVYEYVQDNPVEGVDPTGQSNAYGIYGMPTSLLFGAACMGSCACSFPRGNFVVQLEQFTAFQSTLQPCAFSTCTKCDLGIIPAANHPIAMTQCMQNAMRALFGPGVLCGCN